MAAEILLPPDPVKLAITWLTDNGLSAVKNRPNPVTGEIVAVRRIGGFPNNQGVTDSPWLYVECYAPTDEDASDLGHLAWALLFGMAGEVIDGVQCYEVGAIAGPADMPDPDAQQSRFVMTLQASFRSSVWTPPPPSA